MMKVLSAKGMRPWGRTLWFGAAVWCALVSRGTAQEAAGRSAGSAQGQPAAGERFSTGAAPQLTSSEGDYVLTSGDTIEMSVFREPELSARSTIGRDGTVFLPLIKEVVLAGKSVREARTYLTELYGGKFLRSPQVYLSVAVFAQRKFTIMGQVVKTGSYELQGGQSLDLLEAIGMAGGFTRIADRGKVVVRRRDEAGTVEIFKLNAKRMAEGRAPRFEIRPGDIVTVGESWY